MKVLAVGDIHTKFWIIEAVKKLVNKYDQIIFVGDYADDWNSGPLSTLETWKMLKKFQENNPDKVKLVIGNHDYIYVNNTPTMATGYNTVTQVLINSPEHKDIKEWLQKLPLIEYIDGVMYSHAGVLEAWSERYNGLETIDTIWNDLSPIWVRPDQGFTFKGSQVFGHTPSKTCWEVQHNVWCIDTFSTEPNGSPIGDGSVLEITDGTKFKVKLLEK